MKSPIDIAILDIDNYFLLGLKALLTQHFSRKGESVRFLSDRYRAAALLVIQGDKANRMAYHCRYASARQQHVIMVQETAQRELPACLSEQSRITREVTRQTLLAEVERVLEIRNGPAPPLSCPRCACILTNREWQVLSAIRRCMVPYQVADYLNLSIKTISAHKCNAMNKLGFHRNSELYQWLRQGGLEQVIRKYR